MISDEKKRVLELFAEGRRLYMMQRFEAARGAFRRALAIDPQDGPSHKFIERCEDFLKKPPRDDWDGVYDAKTK